MLKWDNAPAAYGAIFDGSEVRLRFYFAVGRYPLAQVVRIRGFRCFLLMLLQGQNTSKQMIGLLAFVVLFASAKV